MQRHVRALCMHLRDRDKPPDQINPQPPIRRSFRVPLNTEVEATAVIGNRLDHAVGGSCDDLQIAGIAQRLAVVAPDHAASQDSPDGMLPLRPVLRGGRKGVRQVLIKHRTVVEAHQLHAETNAQDR